MNYINTQNSINYPNNPQSLYFQPSVNYPPQTPEDAQLLVDRAIATRKAQLAHQQQEENKIKFKIISMMAAFFVALGTIGFIRGGHVRGLYQKKVDELRGLSKTAPIENFQQTIEEHLGRISTGIGYKLRGLKNNWTECALAKNGDLYEVAALTKEGDLLDPRLDSVNPHILALSGNKFGPKTINNEHNSRSLKTAGGKQTFYMSEDGIVHLGPLNRIFTGLRSLFFEPLFFKSSSWLEYDLQNTKGNSSALTGTRDTERYGHLNSSRNNNRSSFVSEGIG